MTTLYLTETNIQENTQSILKIMIITGLLLLLSKVCKCCILICIICIANMCMYIHIDLVLYLIVHALNSPLVADVHVLIYHCFITSWQI